VDRIAFATLLAGLIVGVQPVRVELAADIRPAAVVFTLDDQKVGTANAPPWQARIDFGTDLRPHELTAEAVDAQGARLAGVSRLINLPAPSARLDILLERGPQGKPQSARLVASSPRQEKPVRQALTLDGKPLALDAGGRAALPPMDLGHTHILSGVAEFAQDAVARTDLAIGGGIADESGSRLTAIALRVAKDVEPSLDSLAGKFRHGGETLRVVAVEKGSAAVLLVRDPSSRLAERVLRRGSAGQGVHLEPDDRVGLIWPLSHETEVGEQHVQLIESAPYFTGKQGGLLWVLTRVSRPKPSTPPYLYADAVAVAGLEAYRSASRRAVVFATSQAADASQLTPAQVRGYLQVLGVPVHTWALTASGPSPWGERERVDSFVAYQRAATLLREDLETQRVAWIAGEWMPGQIELSPDARGITLLR
jgi:hypothetical protein